jgi:hypothetical protein
LNKISFDENEYIHAFTTVEVEGNFIIIHEKLLWINILKEVHGKQVQ